jgi:hypothetical protein
VPKVPSQPGEFTSGICSSRQFRLLELLHDKATLTQYPDARSSTANLLLKLGAGILAVTACLSRLLAYSYCWHKNKSSLSCDELHDQQSVHHEQLYRGLSGLVERSFTQFHAWLPSCSSATKFATFRRRELWWTPTTGTLHRRGSPCTSIRTCFTRIQDAGPDI